MQHTLSSVLLLALSALPACGGSQAEAASDPVHGGGEVGPSCETISCHEGQACVESPDGPTCACTVMAMCVEGHTWDAERCECVATTDTTTAACTTDAECRKEDSYCGGCECLALGPGEVAPACDDPVQCFAQPCAVAEGEPACVDGRCALR